MSAPVVFRPFQNGDVQGLVELFAAAYGRSIDADQYRWKLRTRPSPVENIELAVDPAGRPVFHIAGIPARFRCNGAERWVMVAVDAMTHPAYRRQGLLTRGTTRIFERWREAGIALVLGLPNEQWGSRTRALGWRPLFPLEWLWLPLRPERILARRLGLPFLGRLSLMGHWWDRRWRPADVGEALEVREVSGAGAEFDEIWSYARDVVGRTLVRDRGWVAWRYLASPTAPAAPAAARYRVSVGTRKGRPFGYAAYRRKGESGAIIAEVLAVPGDAAAFRGLVGSVLARLAADGIDVVRTLAVPGSWPHRALRELGFARGRHAFPVECVTLDSALSATDLAAPEGWYLTGGDFDVV